MAAQDEALQPSAAEAVVQLVAALSHAAPRVAALRLLVLVEVLPGAVQAGARPRGLLSAQEAEVAVSVRPSAAESVRRRARGAPPVQGRCGRTEPRRRRTRDSQAGRRFENDVLFVGFTGREKKAPLGNSDKVVEDVEIDDHRGLATAADEYGALCERARRCAAQAK